MPKLDSARALGFGLIGGMSETIDELGPVDYIVVEFPGNKFNGDIAPALGDLVDRDLVRVLDLVFVTKDSGRPDRGVRARVTSTKASPARSRSSRSTSRTC